MKERAVLMAGLLLAACSSQKSATELSPNNNAPIGIAPMREQDDVRREATPQDVDAAPALQAGSRSLLAVTQTQPSSETRYRAIGTEPFWAVTVKGSVATLERPEKAPLHYAISRNDDGRAVRYLADGFAMTLTEGPCSDGMSDAVWSDRVTLAFGEGTLKGCGGVREDF